MAVFGRSQAERDPKPSPIQAPNPKAAPSVPPPRVVIEGVAPEIDCGRFPIKRTVGEEVLVRADVFAEGHDKIAAVLRYRREGEPGWLETPLVFLANDRWEAKFTVDSMDTWEYTLEAWVDHFATWSLELVKKFDAGQHVASELLEGAALVREAAERAKAADEAGDGAFLKDRGDRLAAEGEQKDRVALGLDPALAALMRRHPDREQSQTYPKVLKVTVERERARFGSWYELFPRSTAAEPGRHGTFKDVEARLPYVAGMGFDVLYLPPIHPIGHAYRKGPNNTLEPGSNDPGSPWAIGGPEGGHTAIHSELGTLEDFEGLVEAAKNHGLEIALDIAFQCSPDHPWVEEHPEWFRHRPDGTIKYAENPPKKYQDIYPINFETRHWRPLWEALRDVFLFWAERGVTIFRVDNPHTKAIPFWEWCIREVRDREPGAIFLAEAFTRPKVMKYLAKIGYQQSYSYFTWRNTSAELTEYFTELTQTDAIEYMRPNLFANTPDILHEYLQTGGKPGFLIRLVLAATLGASYGIYGPPFELTDGIPARHGSEEYLDSEKYQVRHWDLNSPWSIRDQVARINAARRNNKALQYDRFLRFHHIESDQLVAYSKRSPDGRNVVLTIVNVDPFNTHSAWMNFPIDDFGIGHGTEKTYQVHDLLTEARYDWRGPWNWVRLDPHDNPAHVFRIDADPAAAVTFAAATR